MMTDVERQSIIDHVRKLDADATKGPWAWDDTATTVRVHSTTETVSKAAGAALKTICASAVNDRKHKSYRVARANLSLVACFRSHAPKLADECEQLATRVAELETSLKEAINSVDGG